MKKFNEILFSLIMLNIYIYIYKLNVFINFKTANRAQHNKNIKFTMDRKSSKNVHSGTSGAVPIKNDKGIY